MCICVCICANNMQILGFGGVGGVRSGGGDTIGGGGGGVGVRGPGSYIYIYIYSTTNTSITYSTRINPMEKPFKSICAVKGCIILPVLGGHES